jgi:hypothetical protein
MQLASHRQAENRSSREKVEVVGRGTLLRIGAALPTFEPVI